MAHAYIDAVAATGADAVKFQTHIAAAESTRREPWRVRFSPQDECRYDYWRRLEFTADQWRGLRDHAVEKELLFLSSPFSPEAVDLLRGLDVPAWKIASGEVANTPLLRYILEDHRPLLVSSGMSDFTELEGVVNMCSNATVPLALLQCTTAYPCPPDRVHLGRMCALEEKFKVPVGLSDHSGTVFPSLAAATLGAAVIEVHVTIDRRMFGPDVVASVTLDELKEIARGTRFIETMRKTATTPDSIHASVAQMRSTFCKSVVARRPLRAGVVLTYEDLACKKPGDGIPATQLDQVIGRTICRDVAQDDLLKWEDFNL